MLETIKDNDLLLAALVVAVIFGYGFVMLGAYQYKGRLKSKGANMAASIIFWVMVSPWVLLLGGMIIYGAISLLGIPAGFLAAVVASIFN